MMKRFFRRFQKLQWKLTLSYTLVTVVTIFLLEIILVLITSLMNYNTPQYPMLLTTALNDATGELVGPMQARPPDLQALQTWVSRSVSAGSILIGQNNSRGMVFASVASTDTLLVLTGPQGQVWVSNQEEGYGREETLQALLSEPEASLLQQALAGNSDYRNQWLRESQTGDIAASAPVKAKDGSVLGAVFVRLQKPGIFQLLIISLVPSLFLALIMGVGAVIIGTCFGYLTARGLTRRLGKINQATHRWGQGDFSANIVDHSADELGEMTTKLNWMAAELASLLEARQELATLQERNRISRDLHDTVKQQVFAISMHLGSARSLLNQKPNDAMKHIETAHTLAHQAQSDLGGLIQMLRPTQLESTNLTQALREHIRVWGSQNNIAAIFHVEGEGKIAHEIEQTLFRITQEALSNIVRHSHASAASLMLRIHPNAVSIEISDNGHGFDLQTPRRGLGLQSIQERAHSLNGQFLIESSEQGTRLEVMIPLAEEGNKE